MRIVDKLAAAALLLAPASASAVELGSPQAGHEYAANVCAACHEVENVDAFSPNPDAPSFKEVANTPGMTARALAVWLQTSHPTMPDIIVKPDDMDDVISYIMSLRTQ